MIKLPSGINVENLINNLKNFSWEASDILLYYSDLIKDLTNDTNIIKNENNDDPVTVADLKVNETIIRKIKENYPNANWQILSEENAKNEVDNLYENSEWLWVLDPLDGTKDFIQGTGNYAMHLALNYNHKPYIGLVLIPERKELWISDGEKFWCERQDRTKKKIVKRKKKFLGDMTLVTSKNHQNLMLNNLVEKINFKKVITMGSIGCKIASIIRGESDIYISLSLPGQSAPKDWDLAAPEAILNASGGKITNLYNQNLSYNKTNFEHGGVIIASNDKENHESICLQVKEIIRKNNIFPLDI